VDALLVLLVDLASRPSRSSPPMSSSSEFSSSSSDISASRFLARARDRTEYRLNEVLVEELDTDPEANDGPSGLESGITGECECMSGFCC
jgi:hypothetical protein